MPSCYCGRCLDDITALRQHQKSKAHCYCSHCDRFFEDQDDGEQHRSAYHSFTCRECKRLFTTLEALSQHMQSSLHVTQFYCCDCNRNFVHEKALLQHLADKIHEPRTKSTIPSLMLSSTRCEKCQREFKTEMGLEQHRSSGIHNPLSDLKCVTDGRCKRQFKSPSAWLQHLESGACSSNITRYTLQTAIQTIDIDHLITRDIMPECSTFDLTVPESMSTTDNVIFTPLTDGSLYSSPPSPASLIARLGMLTPNSESAQLPFECLPFPIKLSCPLCPIGRKPFKTLGALRNHVSSPAHASKVFHCPFAFAGYDGEKATRLMKYFSTLSGLIQHLESGACQGGQATFSRTIEYIEMNLEKMGLRKLRLLN